MIPYSSDVLMDKQDKKSGKKGERPLKNRVLREPSFDEFFEFLLEEELV